MKRTVPIFILTIFALGALLEALCMTWRVGDPGELDYGEGIVIWQASQVFNLQSAFHPLQQYPYLVFHYTPVYHVAVRMLASLLGDLFLSGRIISLAAAFWIVGLLAWTVLRATRGFAPSGIRWFSAALTAAFALMLPTMQWVPAARVDMLGLAFQFTALSVIVVRPFRLRNQIAAFCLLFLGLYTKQSLLAIPVASVLLIGLVRPGRAIRLFSAFMAAGLGVLLLLAWFTHGGVIRHWFLYNVNPLHPMAVPYLELDISKNMEALIAAGLAVFWLTFPSVDRGKWRNWRRSISARLSHSPLRRVGAGFGLVAVFGFATSWGIGKEGANFNYCLDWQLALCPLAGVFVLLLSRIWTAQDRGMTVLRPMLLLLAGITGVQLGVQALLDCNLTFGLTPVVHQHILERRREDAELIKLIASFPGPVVSENMTALLRAGKSIPFEPAIVKQTYDTGIFDESDLVKKTSDKFFDAFILNPDMYSLRFSPRMLQAIHENYRLYPFDGSDYLVYVRR